MISYWILCSLRSTSYKIIVPHTHNRLSNGLPRWPKPEKPPSFFICYHPSPRQPAGEVQSFGPEGWGIVRVSKLKLTFHCFLLCVCASVCEVFLAAWNNIAGCFSFFWKSVGIPVFLLMQCKSCSLYFLHKLFNETAYLRSMQSPGVGITAFFVCPTVGNRPPSER